MERARPLALIGLVLTCPLALPAQGAIPDSIATRAAAATLRSDLRNFVTAQEGYFADHGTYARSLRQMGASYRLSKGVTLVLLTSSDSGHTEIAIVDTVPGLVCAMFVGQLPPPLGTGTEGKPECRGPDGRSVGQGT
jgi:hypothetical protein